MFKLKFILVTPWIEFLKPSVVLNLTHLFITVHQSRFWVATGIGSEELSQTEGTFWKILSGSQNPWVAWKMGSGGQVEGIDQKDQAPDSATATA